MILIEIHASDNYDHFVKSVRASIGTVDSSSHNDDKSLFLTYVITSRCRSLAIFSISDLFSFSFDLTSGFSGKQYKIPLHIHLRSLGCALKFDSLFETSSVRCNLYLWDAKLLELAYCLRQTAQVFIVYSREYVAYSSCNIEKWIDHSSKLPFIDTDFMFDHKIDV